MYSTNKLPELYVKYENIRKNGIEILFDFDKYITNIMGISENNHKDEVLRFKLFNHKILIALCINPDGITSERGILEVCLEEIGKQINLFPGKTIYYDKLKNIFCKDGSFSSDEFPKFVLDNIIPTLLRKYKISFIE